MVAPLFALALLLGSSLPLSTLALSLSGTPTVTSPTRYTEHSVPTLLCPTCVLDTGYAENVERIPSGGVTVSIVARGGGGGLGHAVVGDLLFGAYLALDFVWQEAPIGTLSLTWNENRLARAGYTISKALQSIQYQGRGDDPTEKGSSFTRDVTLQITDIDNNVVTTTFPIVITGRNEAPVINEAPNTPFAYSFLEKAGVSGAVSLFPPLDHPSLSIVDVDDDTASAAEVVIVNHVAGVEDSLIFIDPSFGTSGILSSPWDPLTGRLHLTGLSSFTSYLQALQLGVQYVNNAAYKPNIRTRRVEAYIWDAGASQPGTILPTILPLVALVNVTAVNDPPQVVVGGLVGGGILPELNFTAAGDGVLVIASNVTLYDPDDSFLTLAEVRISSSSYNAGQDELYLRPDGVSGVDEKEVGWGWDKGRGILTIQGHATLDTYERLLHAVAFRNTQRIAPATSPRSISVRVVDSASDGEDAEGGTGELESGWVDVATISVVRINNPPAIAQHPKITYLSIDDGSVAGTEVRNGALSPSSSALDAEDVFRWQVTGGSGQVYFYIDDVNGVIRADTTIDRVVTGANVTLEITLYDRLGTITDPSVKSVIQVYTIEIIDLSVLPTLVLPGTIAEPFPIVSSVRGSMSRHAFLHGRDSLLCFDLAAAFGLGPSSPASSLSSLAFDLEWLPTQTATESMSLFDDRLVSLFAINNKLSWYLGPRPGTRCLRGTPTYGPPLNLHLPDSLSGPSATTLFFRLYVYAHTQSVRSDSNANNTNRPPPQLVLNHDFSLPIDIPGCMDQAARAVPCYQQGSQMSMPPPTFGLYVDTTPCDNDCVDQTGDGICDNLCDLSSNAPPSYACSNPTVGYGGVAVTTAAANPRGNYNPNATTEEGVPCIYPHRVLSANISLPPGPGNALPPLQGVAPLLLPAGKRWPLPNAVRAVGAAGPMVANLAYGTATLRIPLGALLDPVARSFSSQYYGRQGPVGVDGMEEGDELFASTSSSSSSSSLSPLFPRLITPDGSISPGIHNISMAFAFQKFEWPATEPLLPFQSSSSGPTPSMDADLLFAAAPAGIRFIGGVAPAELCVFAGSAALSSSQAAILDPSKRRYPRLYAADVVAGGGGMGRGRGGGVAATSWNVSGSGGIGAAAALDIAGPSSFESGAATITTSSLTYSPWVELPLTSYDGEVGKICTFLSSRLPGLLGVAWSVVPLDQQTSGGASSGKGKGAGGSNIGVLMRMSDINPDPTDPLTLTQGSSSPTWLTPYGGRMWFAATTGRFQTGREVWSVGYDAVGAGLGPVLPSGMGSSSIPNGDWTASTGGGGSGAMRVRQPDALAVMHVDASPTLLADIRAPGNPSLSSDPAWLTVYAGRACAVPGQGNAASPLSSGQGEDDDAEVVGSEFRVDRKPYPRLYFAAAGVDGREIYVYDHYDASSSASSASGTVASPPPPRPLMDAAPGPGPGPASSNPEWLTGYDGSLYWVAVDVVGGESVPIPVPIPRRELWMYTDTRGSATVQSPPSPLARLRGRWAGSNNVTEEGLLLSGYTDPAHLAVCGAADGWAVGDVPPSVIGSPSLLFFSASSLVGSHVAGTSPLDTGRELWALNASDGSFTPFLVADIVPGPVSSNPEDLFCWRGALWFTAEEAATGREVWRVDLAGAGAGAGAGASAASLIAERVTDINPGSASAFTSSGVHVKSGPGSPFFTVYSNQLYFSADDGGTGSPGGSGKELWSTGIGSVNATPVRLVADIFPGPASSSPMGLISYHGLLYFSCNYPGTSTRGTELCAFDGLTPPFLAADIDTTQAAPSGLADGSGYPSEFIVWHDKLWFAADDGDADDGSGSSSGSGSLGVGHGVEVFTYHTDPRPSLTCGAGVHGWHGDSGPNSQHGQRIQVGDRQCAIKIVGIAEEREAGDGFGAAVALDRGRGSGGAASATSAAFIADDFASINAFRPWKVTGSLLNYDGTKITDDRPPGMKDLASEGGGGRLLAVGAPESRRGAGAVHVFVPAAADGTEWPHASSSAWLRATNEAVGDDGRTGSSSSSGAHGWISRGLLVALGGGKGRTPFSVPAFQGDGLGSSVAVYGDIVVAGAPRANLGAGTSSGAVFVWERLRRRGGGGGGVAAGSGSSASFPASSTSNASDWSDSFPLPLLSPNAAEDAALGTSVAMFGNVIVAGSPGHTQLTGAAFVWVKKEDEAVMGGEWMFLQRLDVPLTFTVPLAPGHRFGCTVAVDGGIIAVGACGGGVDGNGAVYLFTWSPMDKAWGLYGGPTSSVLQSPPLPPAGVVSNSTSTPYRFGASLSVHGSYLAIGAPSYPSSGAAFLYISEGSGTPMPFSQVTAIETSSGDGFGTSVGVSAFPFPPSLVAGSPGAGLGGDAAGSAAVFESGGAPPFSWMLQGNIGGGKLLQSARLRPIDAHSGDSFGSSLTVSGGTSAVGAPGEDAGAGAVYITACETAPCSLALGYYVASSCSPGHDRVCRRCSTGRCPYGTFESAPCSTFADRVCTPCSAIDCPPGTVLAAPCMAASDRLCAAVGREGDGEVFFKDTLEQEDEAGAEKEDQVISSCVARGDCAELLSLPALSATVRRVSSAVFPSLTPRQEVVALLDLYYATSGGGGVGGGGALWSSYVAAGTDPCTGQTPNVGWKRGGNDSPSSSSPRGPWPGITCDNSDGGHWHITSLRLQGAGLVGNLPPSFGAALPHVKHLDLSNNLLTGPIPIGLCKLSNILEVLDLSGNALTGGDSEDALALGSPSALALPLPSCLGEMRALTYFALSGNMVATAGSEVLQKLREKTPLPTRVDA